MLLLFWSGGGKFIPGIAAATWVEAPRGTGWVEELRLTGWVEDVRYVTWISRR